MRILMLILLTLSLYSQERIVTLSPALAEIVSGLGEEKHIVGVSDYTLYPSTLQSRPHVGGYTNLSIEKVLALKPTLVIGLEHQKAFLEKVSHFGVKTITLKLESITEIKHGIFVLGEQLQKSQETQMLIEAIDFAINNAPKSSKHPSVLVVFANASSLSRGVYVAGHDLFFEEILEICGAHNAYTDDYALQPILSPENIIATNPDHVLLLLGPLDKTDPLSAKRAWLKLPIKAAKERQIRVIQNDYILIPSQRIAKSITTICKALQ